MCTENRDTRLRIKGRAFIRARAARRIERINQRASIDSSTQAPNSPNSSTVSNYYSSTPPALSSLRNDRVVPSVRAANATCITKPRVNRELLAIALRTVELMRTNRELQIRMANLRRETTEFIIDVMNNPENAEAKAQMIAAQNRLANQNETATVTKEKTPKASENAKPVVD